MKLLPCPYQTRRPPTRRRGPAPARPSRNGDTRASGPSAAGSATAQPGPAPNRREQPPRRGTGAGDAALRRIRLIRVSAKATACQASVSIATHRQFPPINDCTMLENTSATCTEIPLSERLGPAGIKMRWFSIDRTNTWLFPTNLPARLGSGDPRVLLLVCIKQQVESHPPPRLLLAS